MSAAKVSCQNKYALNPKKYIIGPLLISHWLNHAYMSPHTRYLMLSRFFCNYLEGLLLGQLIGNYIPTLITEKILLKYHSAIFEYKYCKVPVLKAIGYFRA